MLLGICLALGIMLGSVLDFSNDQISFHSGTESKRKLNKLIDILNYEYVERVDTDSVVDITVNHILSQLDPHSTYLSPEKVKQTENQLKGNYVGVGISFYFENDSLTVIKALPGGPAYEAGIRGGDKIIRIDKQSLADKELSQDSILSLLEGKAGSKVELVVRRGDSKTEKKFKLKRNSVLLASVEASFMLSDSLGYIKLTKFTQNTAEEFNQALQLLQPKTLSGLVIDLRGNPGGYIDAAKKVADQFLADDETILITQSKKGQKQTFKASAAGLYQSGALYLLIDENSASAAEVLAGAIQDNDRGIIIGQRSFGKGLVQRDMPLDDGSIVRLTISRYFTPSGRSIQRSYKNGKSSYYSELQERYSNGEYYSADQIPIADSLKFYTKNGRIVYGGGGIIPDVFVPKDISYNNPTLQFLNTSGVLERYAFLWLEKEHHRKNFDTLNFETFYEKYRLTHADFSDFKRYLGRQKFDTVFPAYRREILLLIKSAIADQVYGAEAALKVKLSNDKVLKTAQNYHEKHLRSIDALEQMQSALE